jgi:hypothetical protein
MNNTTMNTRCTRAKAGGERATSASELVRPRKLRGARGRTGWDNTAVDRGRQLEEDGRPGAPLPAVHSKTLVPFLDEFAGQLVPSDQVLTLAHIDRSKSENFRNTITKSGITKMLLVLQFMTWADLHLSYVAFVEVRSELGVVRAAAGERARFRRRIVRAVVAIQKPGSGNLQKGAYVRVARDHRSSTATTAAAESGATVDTRDLCVRIASYRNLPNEWRDLWEIKHLSEVSVWRDAIELG